MAPASRKCFDRPFPLFVTRRALTIDSTLEQLFSPCVMITAHFPCQTWSLHQGVFRKGHVQGWGSALEPSSCVVGGDITPKTHTKHFGTCVRKAICSCCSSDLLLEPTQNWKKVTRIKLILNSIRACCLSKQAKLSCFWSLTCVHYFARYCAEKINVFSLPLQCQALCRMLSNFM